MSHRYLIGLLAIIALGVLFWAELPKIEHDAPAVPAADVKSISFTLDGKPVTLVNGVSQVPAAPGSASMITTRYFGNQAIGDLNGDGIPDAAFLVTQDGGGSGTFFYVVAALKEGSSYQGTNAVLLGDRIAPQTTEIRNSEIIVNYADRAPNEPMSVQPSIGVSRYLKVVNGSLVEAAR